MVTKDDAMLSVLELEDLHAGMKVYLQEDVSEALLTRIKDLKAYIRNSENIIKEAI